MQKSGVKRKKDTAAKNTTAASKIGFLEKYRKYSGVGAIFLLFLIVCVLFREFLFSDKMLFSSDQFGSFDVRVLLERSIFDHFQFPLWLSTRLGGMPTIDAVFGDALYPVARVVYSLFSVHRGISVMMLLHVFLAGVFFYILLRKSFSCSRLVSIIGASFYMLSPQFVSHVYPGHDGKMFVIAWLPFIMWRLQVLMDRPGLFNAALMGLGVGMSILTGHVQLSYFMLWGLFLYWVFKLVESFRNKQSKGMLISQGVYFWVGIIFGLGLSFISLYPAYMYVQDAVSVRGIDRGFEYAHSWSFHWQEVFSLWIHDFVGNTFIHGISPTQYYWGNNPLKFNAEYTGMIPVMLSVFALVRKPKSSWRIFWAAIALLAVMFSLGAHTPLFHIAYHIVPGVNRFRAPSMIMFWFTFSTALLGSMFIIDVAKGELGKLDDSIKKKWTKGLLIAIGSVTLLTFLFSSKGFVSSLAHSMMDNPQNVGVFERNFDRNFLPSLWLWWFFAVSVIAMVMAVINNKLGKTTLCIAVLLIGIVDTFRVNSKFIELENPAKFFITDPVIDELQGEMQQQPFRVFPMRGVFGHENNTGAHGLEDISGFHDNELTWYRAFRGGEQDQNYFSGLLGTTPEGNPYLDIPKISRGNPFLNIANVKYVLFRRPDNSLMKLENRQALGRMSFVPGHIVVEDDEDVIRGLQSEVIDYRATVAVSREVPGVTPLRSRESVPEEIGEGFNVEWEKYSPNRRKAQVTMPSEGFLRISEVYYPAWSIKANGEPVDFYRSDVAWMAVHLPEGTHEIEMRAGSHYFGDAATVSFVFVIAIVAISVVEVVKRKKRKKQSA
ncbi:hypothetical protein QA601_17725 [Chitinispirillales bacterium ANBcel5]|uniref:hypothetical protein n=1 Tax=Cellulosispirillum alkaliphilum TaxID=3039283 RepID=UPI002A56207B|nr:hypothetical protein [Chitinispirillales bacterium ANBcel5]